MADNENFKKILRSIERINGVNECLLATMDGMPMGVVDPDSSLISAASAAALGAVSEVMNSLEYGSLEQLIVETDYGRVIMEEMANEYAVIVIADNDANIGMIRVMLRKALKECQGRMKERKHANEQMHDSDLYSFEDSMPEYPVESANGFENVIKNFKDE